MSQDIRSVVVLNLEEISHTVLPAPVPRDMFETAATLRIMPVETSSEIPTGVDLGLSFNALPKIKANGPKL